MSATHNGPIDRSVVSTTALTVAVTRKARWCRSTAVRSCRPSRAAHRLSAAHISSPLGATTEMLNTATGDAATTSPAVGHADLAQSPVTQPASPMKTAQSRAAASRIA